MMQTKPRRAGVAALLIAASFTAGCATTRPPPLSGFLGDYTGFTVDPADPSLLWWEREGFDWARYRAVLLDPIAVYYHADAEGREIVPDELKQVTDRFRAAVVAELGDAHAVTDSPAADVLRIRCAITDVIPVRPALNAVTSLVGFMPIDIGGASIEVEFLDSQTGERLAAGVDQKTGRALGGFASFKRYGHAEQAFRAWAKDLRAAFDTHP